MAVCQSNGTSVMLDAESLLSVSALCNFLNPNGLLIDRGAESKRGQGVCKFPVKALPHWEQLDLFPTFAS